MNFLNIFPAEGRAPSPSNAERGQLAPIVAEFADVTNEGTYGALNALRTMYPNIQSPVSVYDPTNPMANTYAQAQPLPVSPSASAFAMNRVVNQPPVEAPADVPASPDSFVDEDLKYARADDLQPTQPDRTVGTAQPYLGAVAAAPEVSQHDYVEGLESTQTELSNVYAFPANNTAETAAPLNPDMDIDAIRRSIYDIQTGQAA